MEYVGLGSLILAVIVFIVSLFTNGKKQTTDETMTIATVLANFQQIAKDIADMKRDMESLRQSVQEDHDRIIKMEMSLDTAWKRIDEIKEGMQGG